MYMIHLHYLPLAWPLFSLLAGALIALMVLLQLSILHNAYMCLGISSGAALLLLSGSLVGSYFNIPVVKLPEEQVVVAQTITYFGMRYVVPSVVDWPGTVIAVNVGGGLIPGVMSLYLLMRHRLWVQGAVAVACVAAVCHMLATPVPGFGISLPPLVPAMTTALVALLLSRRDAAPLAYIGGSLGTLVGADLLNLGHIQGLGAPIASIGGAGTFDGIFVIGILAVLIAGISRPPEPVTRQAPPSQNSPP